MNTRVILTIVLISFGCIAAILPRKKNPSAQLSASELLAEMKLVTNRISPDELADLMIQKDPSIQLIDVRTREEFEKYHLQGALNIPLSNLLDDEWLPLVDQLSRRNIFYSNGSSLSEQAWILTRQLGFKNNYILEGGLNGWFETIINPALPQQSASSEEWDTYLARKAAGAFFTGSSASQESASALPAVSPVPRKTKSRVKGGCS